MADLWERDIWMGVSSMDDEHLGVLGTLGTLRAAMGARGRELTRSLLERLCGEVRSHFAVEERQMEALRYPMTSSHVAQHTTFLCELDELCASCREDDAAMTMRTVDFVETWFARHVEIADKPLAEWIRSRPPVSPPVSG